MTRKSSASLDYQRGYFARQERTVRIALGDTPTVRRHVTQTLDPLELPAGARVLEVGCGMGRFTEALLGRGYEVAALDLSEFLVGRLRDAFGDSGRLTAIVGRAEDAADLTGGAFDAVVGFFFLHHLHSLEPTFDAIRRVLKPAGRIGFCEPNAFNPLVYLQVTFTPGMSWRGEPGIPHMRPGVVGRILGERGFTHITSSRYGMLPPGIANRPLGGRIERGLEQVPLLRPLSAYRVFHARLG